MKTFVFLIISVVLARCSASVLKKTLAKKSILSCSILSCSKGNLIGANDFVDYFQKISDHCKNSQDTTNNYYGCIMENLGITDEDGTPNLKKMNDFYIKIFSELIIEDIPDFKLELKQCGETYASDFNGVDEIAGSAQSFLKCFTDAVQNFSESIEKVCKLEYQFNGKYVIGT